MKSANLWWQIWVSDYEADTAGLTYEEKGIYIALLNIYWRQQKPLKNDDRRIAKRLGIPLKKWKSVKENLDHLFFECKNNLHHKWMDERIVSALKISEIRAEAGSKGGKAKYQNVANAKQLPEKDTDANSSKPPSKSLAKPRKLKLKLENLPDRDGVLLVCPSGQETKTSNRKKQGGEI